MHLNTLKTKIINKFYRGKSTRKLKKFTEIIKELQINLKELR